MTVMKLIKNRNTVRKYKEKDIPQKIINKIIKGGAWSSALHGFQPWRFLVLRQKSCILEMKNILLAMANKMSVGGRVLLRSTAETLGGARTLIIVYNSREFSDWSRKLGDEYIDKAKVAEVSSIAASVQNMILIAAEEGIGSCWLDMPLFCEQEINDLLNTDKEIVALLTLGYPAEKGGRSKRKEENEIVKYKA